MSYPCPSPTWGTYLLGIQMEEPGGPDSGSPTFGRTELGEPDLWRRIGGWGKPNLGIPTGESQLGEPDFGKLSNVGNVGNPARGNLR